MQADQYDREDDGADPQPTAHADAGESPPQRQTPSLITALQHCWMNARPSRLVTPVVGARHRPHPLRATVRVVCRARLGGDAP
jgi:hypothetical protein